MFADVQMWYTGQTVRHRTHAEMPIPSSCRWQNAASRRRATNRERCHMLPPPDHSGLALGASLDVTAGASAGAPARLLKPTRPAFDIVAITASLGGLDALGRVLGALPPDFPVPILVVQHLSARYPSHLAELLGRRCALPVIWTPPGQRLRGGEVYIAPPDWHILVGSAHTVHLAQTPRVQYVRPSADVLFESVAAIYRERAIAVVLTGMCNDGAQGAHAIKRAGGRVFTQDAATSKAFGMPRATITTGCVDFVLPLAAIAPALVAFTMVPGAAALLSRSTRASANLIRR